MVAIYLKLTLYGLAVGDFFLVEELVAFICFDV